MVNLIAYFGYRLLWLYFIKGVEPINKLIVDTSSRGCIISYQRTLSRQFFQDPAINLLFFSEVYFLFPGLRWGRQVENSFQRGQWKRAFRKTFFQLAKHFVSQDMSVHWQKVRFEPTHNFVLEMNSSNPAYWVRMIIHPKSASIRFSEPQNDFKLYQRVFTFSSSYWSSSWKRTCRLRGWDESNQKISSQQAGGEKSFLTYLSKRYLSKSLSVLHNVSIQLINYETLTC